MATIRTRSFKTIFSVSVLMATLLGCTINSKPCNQEILSKDERTGLFVNKWNWGVNGNSQMVAISNKKLSSQNDIEKDRDYVFDGAFPLFVKLESDTLFIYTYKLADEPTQPLLRGISVVQIEIANPENMRLRSDTTVLNIERICLD